MMKMTKIKIKNMMKKNKHNLKEMNLLMVMNTIEILVTNMVEIR